MLLIFTSFLVPAPSCGAVLRCCAHVPTALRQLASAVALIPGGTGQGMGDWCCESFSGKCVMMASSSLLLSSWGCFFFPMYSTLCYLLIILQFYICIILFVCVVFDIHCMTVLYSVVPQTFLPSSHCCFLLLGWWAAYSPGASSVILCLYFQGVCSHPMCMLLFYSRAIGNQLPVG